MRARTRYAAAALLAATLTLAGCRDDPDEPGAPGSATPGSSGEAGDLPGTDRLPDGGTADAPAPVEATTELLDWAPLPGSTEDTVTRSGPWLLRVSADGSRAELTGPDGTATHRARGRRVSDALIDGEHAVVVLQDRLEERPARAVVVDLATGEERVLDGSSRPPTVNGGTWALGEGRLLHATLGEDRSYCLGSAPVDEPGDGEVLWCAPERTGFNQAHVTSAGTAVLAFDDSRPACRTVAAVGAVGLEPFPGIEDCKAFEGLLTEGGAVWSVVPRERRIEEALFRARIGEEYFDLGPGTAGTLTWCADAAWFVRDPQRQGEPARLLRWHEGTGLTVAYESPGGESFLLEPRCGGDTLSVSAFAEDGDEQVSASLE